MKKIFLSLLFLFTSFQFSFAQKRIEILVNDVVQNVSSEAIRVKNNDDKIELRIYLGNTTNKETLLDSLKVKGCYYSQSQQQEQQSQSNNKPSMNKENWTTFLKSKANSTFLSFEFSVQQITSCQGEYFYLYPMYNKSKSSINTFKSFQSKYKFYFVQ